MLSPTLASAGCGALDVTLEGTVRTALVEPVASRDERPIVLAFTRTGGMTVNGQLVELPQAEERRQFGVTLVDAAALPPVWRPGHAPRGGVLIASLHKASPLAIRGPCITIRKFA